MMNDPQIPRRRSIRLKGYDYSWPNAYFITLCTRDKRCLFGGIKDGKMTLNSSGLIVRDQWLCSFLMRPAIRLDKYVIMPNHFHAVLMLRRGDLPVARLDCELSDNTPGARPCGPTNNSIGSIVAGFKAAVTKRINELRQSPRCPVWQRNYYEHIIRNEADLLCIREYIKTNPANWHRDDLYQITNG